MSQSQVPLSDILAKQAQLVRFNILNEELFPGGGSDTDSDHPDAIDGKAIALEDTDKIISGLLSKDSKYKVLHNLTDEEIRELEQDVTNSESLHEDAGLGIADALMEFGLVCDYMWGDRKGEEPVPTEVRDQLRGGIYTTAMKVVYQGRELIICRLDASSEVYRIDHENQNLCLQEGDMIPEDSVFREIKAIDASCINTDK